MKKKLNLILVTLITASNCLAQWTSDSTLNTPVSVLINNQQNPRIVSDGANGAMIAWEDFRNDTLRGDVYVQRLNSLGYPMWTANGIGVCTDAQDQKAINIIESDNGSSILVWVDYRSTDDYDIYAQKVDTSGNVLWSAGGVPVCTSVGRQSNPWLVSDGAGGAIITWEDSISTIGYDIYTQRIDNNGAQMWTAGGVAICTASNQQINPKIKTDGAGGAIIAWQDKRNGIEYYIFAQRINSTGVVLWAANGVTPCIASGGQTNMKLEPDGNNGAYLAWQDKRSAVDYDIYAQRINGSGVAMWSVTGVAVCAVPGAQSAIDMTTDGVNGAIISWKDVRTGIYQIYANKISPSGTMVWSAFSAGNLIGNGINPNIVGDGNGGGILTWQDSTSALGTWNIYTQRLDSAGIKLWNINNVEVSIADHGQTYPKNIRSGNGGCIYSWQDKRDTLNGFDIYAHHIYPNGVGAISHIGVNEFGINNFEINCYPNPFNKQTTILLKGSKPLYQWQLNVYDLQSKKIISQSIKNSNQFILQRNDLNEGIYFFQASSNSEILGSGKFVITK